MAGATLGLKPQPPKGENEGPAKHMDFKYHYAEVHGLDGTDEDRRIRYVQLDGLYDARGSLVRAAGHMTLAPLTFDQELDRVQALRRNQKLFGSANARAQAREAGLPASVIKAEQENHAARLAEQRAG